jgi:YVTN family beta-propeller protein
VYSLGIDLGTTFAAAAVARSTGVEMFTLGDNTVVSPSVVFLQEDGTVVTGDAANRRAVSHPERIGREFKRRLGDPTPIMLSGATYPVTALLGALLGDIVQKVIAAEGQSPEWVVLTHPANWGPFRRELFGEVPSAAGLEGPLFVTEPEAAAAYYATSGRLADGEIVAVYDLGGGTFDATVVRKLPEGMEILGTPEGIERLGGVDFDEAVLTHVNYSSGGALSELDLGDAQTAVALARLRQDCVQAKEALSLDTEAVIPVFLPGRHFDVRLTRSGFEDMVRAPIESTIGALFRTLQSARLEPADLSAVLLVGGSSRIPLIAQMVAQALGRPTVADAHPKYAVALGAATLAAPSAQPVLAVPRGGREAAASAVRVDGVRARPPTAGAALTVASAQQGVVDASASPPLSGDALSPGVPQPRSGSADVGGRTVGYEPGTAGWNGAHARAGGTSAHQPTESLVAPHPGPGKPPSPPRGTARGSTSGGPASPSSPVRRVPVAVAAILVVVVVALGLALALWPSRPTGGAFPPVAGPPPPTAPEVTPTPTVPPPVSIPTPTVAGAFRVNGGPQAGAVTPDGKSAYVTSTSTNSISVVDLASNAVVASIPISAGPPEYVAFTNDGRFAYVSVYDPIRQIGNVIVVVDTASRTVTGSIPAEKYPYAMSLTPNGRQLYVPNHDADLVSVVDTATNTVINKIKVKPNPHAVGFSVDGRRAYVANHASNLVTVLDTKNGAVLAEIPVGHSPHSIAMAPDGSRIYVVNYDGDSVSVIDPAATAVVGTIAVQRQPQSVAFAPDGQHAYVVNDGSNTVSVIDTATSQVTATIRVGQTPTNIFVAPDGKHAYVTNISSNDVTVLNIAG